MSSLLCLPPSHPPYPTPLGGHKADLPVLCGCFPLAIYFTFGSVYKRSEEHTSELQSHSDLVCRLLLEKKNGHEEQE